MPPRTTPGYGGLYGLIGSARTQRANQRLRDEAVQAQQASERMRTLQRDQDYIRAQESTRAAQEFTLSRDMQNEKAMQQRDAQASKEIVERIKLEQAWKSSEADKERERKKNEAAARIALAETKHKDLMALADKKLVSGEITADMRRDLDDQRFRWQHIYQQALLDNDVAGMNLADKRIRELAAVDDKTKREIATGEVTVTEQPGMMEAGGYSLTDPLAAPITTKVPTLDKIKFETKLNNAEYERRKSEVAANVAAGLMPAGENDVMKYLHGDISTIGWTRKPQRTGNVFYFGGPAPSGEEGGTKLE